MYKANTGVTAPSEGRLRSSPPLALANVQQRLGLMARYQTSGTQYYLCGMQGK